MSSRLDSLSVRLAVEKLEFRLSQPGIRKLPGSLPRTPLATSEVASLAFIDRRSHRRFGAGVVDFQRFGGLLGCVTQRHVADAPFPKYAYGSAGNLYSIQTYVYAKGQCLEKIGAGYYYHDPAAHSLVALSESPALEPWRFGPNRPVFERAAFGLFLVAHMDAITPMYGDTAMRFACIEAGLMTQLLELTAAKVQIGMCQLGGGDFRDLATRFLLASSDVLVHTLLGGLPEAP